MKKRHQAAHAAAPAGRGIGGRHHGTGHAAYFTGGPGRAGGICSRRAE